MKTFLLLVLALLPQTARPAAPALDIVPQDGGYGGDLSHDGTLYAESQESGTEIVLWDWRRNIMVRRLDCGGVALSAWSFHPKKLLLATGGGDGQVQLWDPSSGKRLRSIQISTNQITTFKFSGDGSRLVVASDPDLISVWETTNWSLIREFRGNTNRLFLPCVNENGSLVATIDGTLARIKSDGEIFYDQSDRTISKNCVHPLFEIRVWDVLSGTSIFRTNANRDSLAANTVALHPRLPLLALGKDFGNTTVLSLSNAQILQGLNHPGGVPHILEWIGNDELMTVCEYRSGGGIVQGITNYLWKLQNPSPIKSYGITDPGDEERVGLQG